jgi:protein-tyrosine-phosphatase
MSTQMSPLMRSALEDATRRLAGSFRGVFSEKTVARVVEDSYDQMGDRPTVGPNFMPIFIERFARERLQAVAQAEGLAPKPLPEVLFICVRNAGRSQMAAALAHELSSGQVAVRSAGSDPTEKIHPVVVEAMAELGIDARMQFPKPLTDEVVRAADVVITLGCGDACPVFPGKRYEDWEVADPAGQPLEVVRRIRYDIHHHVTDLLDSLNVDVVDPSERERRS